MNNKKLYVNIWKLDKLIAKIDKILNTNKLKKKNKKIKKNFKIIIKILLNHNIILLIIIVKKNW